MLARSTASRLLLTAGVLLLLISLPLMPSIGPVLALAGLASLAAKPMATLQSALQRLKEQGEVENTGRNHWRLHAAETASPVPATPPPAAPASRSPQSAAPAPAAPLPAGWPPVVTSTTTFGSRFGAGE